MAGFIRASDIKCMDEMHAAIPASSRRRSTAAAGPAVALVLRFGIKVDG